MCLIGLLTNYFLYFILLNCMFILEVAFYVFLCLQIGAYIYIYYLREICNDYIPIQLTVHTVRQS